MLDTLITSKTRVKLLIKFFINSKTRSYLRDLSNEFGESSNSIRIELNRLEQAGLLNSSSEGNRKYFQANEEHPLFNDLKNIIHKYVGIDQIIDTIVEKVGNVERVFLTGPVVSGIDNGIIQIVLIGKKININYLSSILQKVEKLINRKISFICFEKVDFENFSLKQNNKFLLIWESGNQEYY